MDAILRKVRRRRLWEAWMGFSRDIGTFMSGIWLTLLYFVALAPFRLFARLESGGWRASPRPAGGPLSLARAES